MLDKNKLKKRSKDLGIQIKDILLKIDQIKKSGLDYDSGLEWYFVVLQDLEQEKEDIDVFLKSNTTGE